MRARSDLYIKIQLGEQLCVLLQRKLLSCFCCLFAPRRCLLPALMSCLVQRETSLGSSRLSGWLLNLKKTTRPAVLVSYRGHTEVRTMTPVWLLYDIFSSLTSAFVKIRTPLHD